MINGVLGVVKAYATRVGEGPMPTELLGASGDRLRDSGKEFGSVTGRPRRCGWYDVVVARYAARINGLDSVALTKLDVLDGLDEIKVCTGYRLGNDVISEWPADLNVLAKCEPVYETLPGWSRPSSGVTRYEDLPREAQQYVAFLEEATGVPVSIVSTGSGRNDTIIREKSAAAEWFGVGASVDHGGRDVCRLQKASTAFGSASLNSIPGAVARHAFRNLEERPRDRRAEFHHPQIIGQHHPHPLLRLQRRRAQNLRAMRREVDDRWRARRRFAPRCPRPCGNAARGACRDSRDSVQRAASASGAGSTASIRVSAACRRRAGRRMPNVPIRRGRAAWRDAVGAVERDDANFGVRQRRIGLDAIDQRGPTRGRGEQPLERNHVGLSRRDGLERLQRLGVAEDQHLAVAAGALAQRVEQLVRHR